MFDGAGPDPRFPLLQNDRQPDRERLRSSRQTNRPATSAIGSMSWDGRLAECPASGDAATADIGAELPKGTVTEPYGAGTGNDNPRIRSPR